MAKKAKKSVKKSGDKPRKMKKGGRSPSKGNKTSKVNRIKRWLKNRPVKKKKGFAFWKG